MSKTKCFGLILGVLGGATIAQASTSSAKISDELYSENLYLERASAEIPTSLEASARESGITVADVQASAAIESIDDLDSAPVKKKGKKSKNQVSF